MNAAPPRYDDAVALLHSLSGPWGIRASASNHANYGAVFARDAVMAGTAGVLTQDPVIAAGLARTLEHLRALQGAEGQIASNYTLSESAPPRVSFGTMVPRIDAALWYLIGIGIAARAGILDASPFAESAGRVVRLLDAIEYNGRHLLYLPVGANWADEYVYDGYVLHEQVLRAWALRLASKTFGNLAWRDKATSIEHAVEEAFVPRDAGHPYPLAAFSPVRVHDVFDLATCALLGASGVAPSLTATALDWIDQRYLTRGVLPPVFHPVIEEGDPDWPALVRYQLHGFRNRPHEYHNGGIWMIWLGWLAIAMARTGRRGSLALLQRAAAAQLVSSEDFAFQEYFHGRTGQAAGTAFMAYSATGVLFLRAAENADALAILAP